MEEKQMKNARKQLALKLFDEFAPQVQRIQIAGSIRRKEKEPGDIDFVMIPEEGKSILGLVIDEEFKVNWKGEQKVQVVIDDIKVDIRSAKKEYWGAMLMHSTGGKWFNIAMRAKAKNRGMKLNEYGLWNAKGERIAGETEEGILKKLGKKYIEPEDRV
jgi:DNA polymerase (family 10)